MSEHTIQSQQYKIGIRESQDTRGSFMVTCMPAVEPGGPNGTPKRMLQYAVAARQESSGLTFDWSGTPDDPGTAREELEAVIAARMHDRASWIERVSALVEQVEQWACELGWATRRVDKKLEDERIGTHRVPALLMQEATCRVILEPVGRSTVGAEGVVDLYLMPAYDDIARLYYHDGHWQLHHQLSAAKPALTVRASQAVPLSKDSLQAVLAELRQHAA